MGEINQSRRQTDHDVLPRTDWDQTGFTEQEQQSILREIDRLTISPSLALNGFKKKKIKKKGIGIPLLINLICLGILGLTFLWSFRSRKELSAPRETRYFSAETQSRIIQNLKQEIQKKLADKDLKINDLNKQLREIRLKEKNLRGSYDKNLRAFKNKLDLSLKEAVKKERERLRKKGLDDRELVRLLAAFRVQKEKEYRLKMARYTERENKRFRNLLKEIKRKEQLRLEKRKSLEKEKSSLRRNLSGKTEKNRKETGSLTRELQKMRENKQQEQFFVRQITTLFDRIRSGVRTKNFEAAEKDIRALRRLLDGPQTKQFLSVQIRKNSDLSLARYIEENIKEKKAELSRKTPAKPETEKPLSLADPRKAAAALKQGDRLLKQGDLNGALNRYMSALVFLDSSRPREVGSAEEGIRAVVRKLSEQNQKYRRDIQSLSKRLKTLESGIKSYRSRFSASEQKLRREQTRNKALTHRLEQSQNEEKILRDTLKVASGDVSKLLNSLKIKQDVNLLTQYFLDFKTELNAGSPNASPQARKESQEKLNRFLGSSPVDSMLPGLESLILKYYQPKPVRNKL